MLCLMGWLALASGCASFGVRCDSRLRPINPRQPQVTQPRPSEGALVPPLQPSKPTHLVRP